LVIAFQSTGPARTWLVVLAVVSIAFGFVFMPLAEPVTRRDRDHDRDQRTRHRCRRDRLRIPEPPNRDGAVAVSVDAVVRVRDGATSACAGFIIIRSVASAGPGVAGLFRLPPGAQDHYIEKPLLSLSELCFCRSANLDKVVVGVGSLRHKVII
jgi:hypothetical protein